jgi:hypothetical protein
VANDYRAAVKYLKARPGELTGAFTRPFTHPAGGLFLSMSPDGHFHALAGPRYVGCPLCVALGSHVSWSIPATTLILRAGLPGTVNRLTGKHLEAMCNLQMHLDLTLRDKAWRLSFPGKLIAPWPGDRVDPQDWEHEYEPGTTAK